MPVSTEVCGSRAAADAAFPCLQLTDVRKSDKMPSQQQGARHRGLLLTEQMPRRPRQHVLADDAVADFRSRFPGWVVRSLQENDYGVDAEVEVFDTDGFATGLTFKAQIKGTDRAAKRTGMGVPIARASLNYWRSLDVPVLVFLFSAKSGVSFARWAHSLDESAESRSSDRESRTLTFRFRKVHEISNFSLNRLIAELNALRALRNRVSLAAIPVRVTATKGEVDAAVVDEVEAELVEALNRTRGALRQCREADAPSVVAELQLRKSAVRFVMPAEIASCTLRYPDELQTVLYVDMPRLCADALIAAAATMGVMGLHRQAVQMHKEFSASSTFGAVLPCVEPLVPAYLEQGDYVGALQLVGPALLDGDPEVRELAEIASAPLLFGDLTCLGEDGAAKLVDILRASSTLERRDGRDASAANRIYLASNVSRAMRHFDVAVELMRELPQLEPAYLLRGYYYRELGGSLADLDRWHEAAEEYAKGMDVEAPASDLRFVLADSFLHCGRYADGLALCRDREGLTETFQRKLCILQIALSFITQVVGVDTQYRSQLIQVAPPAGEDEHPPAVHRTLARLAETDALDESLLGHLFAAVAQSDSDSDELMLLGLTSLTAWLQLDVAGLWLIAAAAALEAEDKYLAESLLDSMWQFCRAQVSEAIEKLKEPMPADRYRELRTLVFGRGRRETHQPPNLIRVFSDSTAPRIFYIS